MAVTILLLSLLPEPRPLASGFLQRHEDRSLTIAAQKDQIVADYLFAYQQAAQRIGPVEQGLLLPADFWADLRTLRRSVAGDNGLAYTMPEWLWAWWWLVLLVLWALVFLPWFWLRKESLWSWRTAGLAVSSLLALALTAAAFRLGQQAHAPGTWLDAGRPLFVVKEAATLRQGNGLSYPAVSRDGRTLTLRPGTEGWRRAQRSNGWVQVELVDGTVGWLPRASLLLEE